MSRRLPRWLWPRSMAVRLILALLCALVVSQVISFAILFDERRAAIRVGQRDAVLSRTAALVRLLRDTPPQLHGQILQAANTRQLRYWIDDESALDTADGALRDNPSARLLRQALNLDPGLSRPTRHDSAAIELPIPRGWRETIVAGEIVSPHGISDSRRAVVTPFPEISARSPRYRPR